MKARAMLTGILVMAMLTVIYTSHAAEKTTSKQKEDASKTPTSATTIKATQEKTLTGTLADVNADRVWLDDQGQINFKLRNSGKRTMPTPEHNQGVVRVYFGKGYEDFLLAKRSPKGKAPVDPKGALKKPGKTVSYNAKITLGKQANVKVIVVHGSKTATLKTAKAKTFTLTPTKKDETVPDTRLIGFERGSLTVTSPGRGGEHFVRGQNVINISWRFCPGSSGVMPTNWVVTVMSWDPASGYADVLSMDPRVSSSAAYPFGESAHDGCWEYTFPWIIPEDFPDGTYKVRVQGGRWEDEGSLNFSIGRSWNVSPSRLRFGSGCDLIVSVSQGGDLVSGACDFLVELLDPSLDPSSDVVLESWEVHSRLVGSTRIEDVNLGHIGGRLREVDCCSRSEICSVLIRVTVDSTDRIKETNERRNTIIEEMYCPSCWGERCPESFIRERRPTVIY
jgi:hypothetical protein